MHKPRVRKIAGRWYAVADFDYPAAARQAVCWAAQLNGEFSPSFLAAIDHASRTVASWPEWKQNAARRLVKEK